MSLKAKGFTFLALGLLCAGITVQQSIVASYLWKQEFGSHWSLADKSSTLKDKSVHIERFVEALDTAGLRGTHDAVFLKTTDNAFDHNLAALTSLRDRLHEARAMDVTSLAYQTAIQQVTAQEQGEASAMLDVLRGCWTKAHYPLCWGWIEFTWIALWIAALLVGGLLIALHADRRQISWR